MFIQHPLPTIYACVCGGEVEHLLVSNVSTGTPPITLTVGLYVVSLSLSVFCLHSYSISIGQVTLNRSSLELGRGRSHNLSGQFLGKAFDTVSHNILHEQWESLYSSSESVLIVLKLLLQVAYKHPLVLLNLRSLPQGVQVYPKA